jgi:hypothetical protein
LFLGRPRGIAAPLSTDRYRAKLIIFNLKLHYSAAIAGRVRGTGQRSAQRFFVSAFGLGQRDALGSDRLPPTMCPAAS